MPVHYETGYTDTSGPNLFGNQKPSSNLSSGIKTDSIRYIIEP